MRDGSATHLLQVDGPPSRVFDKPRDTRLAGGAQRVVRIQEKLRDSEVIWNEAVKGATRHLEHPGE